MAYHPHPHQPQPPFDKPAEMLVHEYVLAHRPKKAKARLERKQMISRIFLARSLLRDDTLNSSSLGRRIRSYTTCQQPAPTVEVRTKAKTVITTARPPILVTSGNYCHAPVWTWKKSWTTTIFTRAKPQ